MAAQTVSTLSQGVQGPGRPWLFRFRTLLLEPAVLLKVGVGRACLPVSAPWTKKPQGPAD